MPYTPITVLYQSSFAPSLSLNLARYIFSKKMLPIATLFSLLSLNGQVQADSMSALIMEKSVQPELAVPAARVSTRSTIQRVRMTSPATVNVSRTNSAPTTSALYPAQAYQAQTYRPQNHYNQNNQVQTPQSKPPQSRAVYATAANTASNPASRYPEVKRQAPSVLPAFLSGGSIAGSYDNVDSAYLPLLSRAENQSNRAARDVVSMARTMSLNERMIIKGGCWDYLNAVFNRAGVNRSTVHKGIYKQGPYANSNDIQVGDWLYYINHGYNDIEHSGLFVGWVDEPAKQALILSYAGESRQEPARYRVYDLSHVYQIIRPT